MATYYVIVGSRSLDKSLFLRSFEGNYDVRINYLSCTHMFLIMSEFECGLLKDLVEGRNLSGACYFARKEANHSITNLDIDLNNAPHRLLGSVSSVHIYNGRQCFGSWY